jgi:hypothetical protein
VCAVPDKTAIASTALVLVSALVEILYFNGLLQFIVFMGVMALTYVVLSVAILVSGCLVMSALKKAPQGASTAAAGASASDKAVTRMTRMLYTCVFTVFVLIGFALALQVAGLFDNPTSYLWSNVAMRTIEYMNACGFMALFLSKVRVLVVCFPVLSLPVVPATSPA